MIGQVFSAYSEYMDSGIDWLGKIPKHWILKPLFTLMKERNERNIGNKEQNILSLSYGKIIRRNVDDNFGLLPASFETYQIVQDGNIIMRLTDLQNDKRSLRVGLVKELGIITSAYVCLEIIQELETSFAYSLLHSYDLTKIFYSLGGGVRQSMNYEDLKRLPILCPPIEEQKQIATFLDRATTEIDQIIEQQKQLITLLEEERTTVNSHAVTKGLDPSVPMKDSGIEWLGEIPKHWDVKRLKLISTILRGKFTHRPRNDPKLYDGAYPFIQTGDIATANKYITEYQQTLNEVGLSVSKMFPKGTLVMTIAANIGDTAILDFPACFPDSIVGFVPQPILNLEYLYHCLSAMKEELMSNAVLNTQLNLNVERIGSISIAYPSIQEQLKIVIYIESETARIDEAIDNVRSQIEKLEEYRTVLISDAVTGKIDVRRFVS